MRLVLAVLLLCGCAQRYLRVTASSALECEDVTVRERSDGWLATGCGRSTLCNRVWWSGADEWSCESAPDGGR